MTQAARGIRQTAAICAAVAAARINLHGIAQAGGNQTEKQHRE